MHDLHIVIDRKSLKMMQEKYEIYLSEDLDDLVITSAFVPRIGDRICLDEVPGYEFKDGCWSKCSYSFDPESDMELEVTHVKFWKCKTDEDFCVYIECRIVQYKCLQGE